MQLAAGDVTEMRGCAVDTLWLDTEAEVTTEVTDTDPGTLE